jgi:exonuclease VII small subunit
VSARPGQTVEGITVPLGDPDALQAAGKQLEGVAVQLQSSSSGLVGLPNLITGWAGPGSSAFAEITGQQATSVQSASLSVTMAAFSVESSADALQDAQHRAERAITRAKKAREEINQAKEDIRQARADQASATLRMITAAAERAAAENNLVSSVVDAFGGSGAAAAAVNAADAAYRDAERDLHEAEHREKRAQKRLDDAEDDLRDARKDGQDAADDAELVGIGLQMTLNTVPTAAFAMPGAPSKAAMGDAGNVPKPQAPDVGDVPITEREPPENWPWWMKEWYKVGRGEAAAIAGTYNLGKGAVEHPTKIPGALGDVASSAYHDPIGFGKNLVGYDDLANGRFSDWFGGMGISALAGAGMGRASRFLPRKAPVEVPPAVARPWRRGDDVYAPTAAGNEPNWNTVRGRFWKNVAADPRQAAQWDAANLERMKQGLAPQRFNPDKGDVESMELSHEPVPKRDGGRDIVPRWPQDHAAVDPHRHPGY